MSPVSGQATFEINVRNDNKKGKTVGNFSYIDPAAGLSIVTSKISSLVITGNHAQFSGTAKQQGGGKHKQKFSFTVNVTDNGPGPSDTFSITVSNGYSASGNLTGGDIIVQ